MSRTFKDMPSRVMRDRAMAAGYWDPGVTIGSWERWDRVMIAVEQGNDALINDWTSWLNGIGYDVELIQDVDLSNDHDDGLYSLRLMRRTVFDDHTWSIIDSLEPDDQPSKSALDPIRGLPADAVRATVIVGLLYEGTNELHNGHVDVDSWLSSEHDRDSRMPDGKNREPYETDWTHRSTAKNLLRGIVKEANSGAGLDELDDVPDKDPGARHWWDDD